jgi:hypothetical protein
MQTDIQKIRLLCRELEDEALIESFRRYSIREYEARSKYEAHDDRYVTVARRYDCLRDELSRRLMKRGRYDT